MELAVVGGTSKSLDEGSISIRSEIEVWWAGSESKEIALEREPEPVVPEPVDPEQRGNAGKRVSGMEPVGKYGLRSLAPNRTLVGSSLTLHLLLVIFSTFFDFFGNRRCGYTNPCFVDICRLKLRG